MRNIFLSTLFVLSMSLISTAQLTIPNGDFELWETTPTFSYDPVDWHTMNGQLVVSTTQDSMPHEGLWGMKVSPIPNGIGEEGIAWIEIPTSEIPPSLNFHVKYERTASCAVWVSASFFNGENEFYTETWYPDDLSSDWTAISMELDQLEPIMTHVRIEVVVTIGDLVPGDGWISVDAMDFGLVNSVDDWSKDWLPTYPNPANNHVFVSDLKQNEAYKIYDLQGKLVSSAKYQNYIDTSNLPTGQYILRSAADSGIVRQAQFTVQH